MAKKILVIDDDSRNIFALCAVLKAKGYTCIAASAAIHGINTLETDNSVGMVLLDMMMPDMDGYQALHLIRNHDKLHSIPVIAVTAQAMAGDRDKCLEAGADEYIAKPIDVDLLVRYLEQYLKN